MTFRNVLVIVLSFLFTGSFAQIKDYSYKFTIKGLQENDTIYLANYLGKNLYYSDTAYVGKNGTFVFAKKREIQPGQFAVVWDGGIRFELIINEPAFFMKTDTIDLVKNMVIEGSEENKVFYKYIDFLNLKKDEITPFRQLFDSAKTEEEKEKYRGDISRIDTEVKDYQKKIASEHSNLLIGKIIGMAEDIKVPDAPKKADGTTDSLWSYYYYRDHYFDNIDLKNNALARNPSYHNKLEYFYSQVVLQHPDTICEVTDRLVARMNPKGDLFKYTVTYVVENYNKSEIMGMRDGVFVCIADKFYLKDRAFWVDSARVEKIRERAETYRPLLIGQPAYPLSLADTTYKNWLRLYDKKSEFTVLVFWDPDCGHCKKDIPKLAELYTKTAGKAFDVYAVSSDASDKWKKFIVENKLTFTNVAVPAEVRTNQQLLYKLVTEGTTDEKSLNHHKTFDIYSTPQIFLLDKNKKIVAKQIAMDQLEDIIQKIKQAEKNKKS